MHAKHPERHPQIASRHGPPFLSPRSPEHSSGRTGNYSCGNNETLNTDYKTRAGFEGWVMSDWVRLVLFPFPPLAPFWLRFSVIFWHRERRTR